MAESQPKLVKIIPASGKTGKIVLPYKPEIMNRPKDIAKRGKACRVTVNAFEVSAFPTGKIYQYDVMIGLDGAKRGLIKKVWNSPQLQSKFGDSKGHLIFDGVRIAWSPQELPIQDQLNMMVDLDLDDPPRNSKSIRDNKHRVVIRRAGFVPMGVLQLYLNKKVSFDKEVLACVNFIDHLLRETPASKFITIKRSFFQNAGASTLPGGVEAWKGIFQSARLADGARLLVNVDVATCVFWTEGSLMELACRLLRLADASTLESRFMKEGPKGKIARDMRKLKKILFFCKHRTADSEGKAITRRKLYTIEGFGDTADATTFERRIQDANGNDKTEKTTVRQYYQTNYNIRLRHPGLPLVKTRKKGEFFPMELAFVGPGQRYPYKLDDRQTADMIKFTVTRPSVRLNQIKENVAQLDWAKDPMLVGYDMRIDTKMVETKARVLPTPRIKYQNEFVQPRDGRWDLRGKKFVHVAKKPLKSWGVLIFNSPREVNEHSIKNFLRTFIQTYTSHGGLIENKFPIIMYADSRKAVATNIFEFFKVCGNSANCKPDILMFVLANKQSQPYGDIKGYCDINIGCVSQCLQTKHVLQAKPQYCSNVCMKFNAKLGGSTHELDPVHNPLHTMKDVIMLVGADVSHSAPGHKKTSYASMVGTTDLEATRYAAVADTNGSQVEIINTRNTVRFFMMLLRIFRVATQFVPKRILYFRDGVSEGQYQKVLDQEYADMLRGCATIQPGYRPLFTVIVCSKRHHYRLFPVDKFAADKHNNPVPGLIVDKDITQPDKFDFYLNSHCALQGTARPVHYQVLVDDNGIPQDSLHGIIYNYCYTYIRSTTSVSLVPAAYYAHLASARSRMHQGIECEIYTTSSSDPSRVEEVTPLKVLHEHMRPAMWFV